MVVFSLGTCLVVLGIVGIVLWFQVVLWYSFRLFCGSCSVRPFHGSLHCAYMVGFNWYTQQTKKIRLSCTTSHMSQKEKKLFLSASSPADVWKKNGQALENLDMNSCRASTDCGSTTPSGYSTSGGHRDHPQKAASPESGRLLGCDARAAQAKRKP